MGGEGRGLDNLKKNDSSLHMKREILQHSKGYSEWERLMGMR